MKCQRKLVSSYIYFLDPSFRWGYSLCRLRPMTISPRFMKRFLSAILLGPVALMLMVGNPITFLIVVIPAFLLALHEWLGIVRACDRRKILTAIFGVPYIAMAFYTFAEMRLAETEGWMTALFVIVAVWSSDTGGYVFGKAYGGPKWVPGISPNKTWAGLGGAMIGAGLAAMIFGLVLYALELAPFEFIQDFLWGLVLGLVCQIGDLLISVFKRRANLKDTGNIIPGHGGILDRIDSLMAASLFVYVFMHI